MKQRRLIFESVKLLLRRSFTDPGARQTLLRAIQPLATFLIVESALIALVIWTFPAGRKQELVIFLTCILGGGLVLGYVLRRMQSQNAPIALYPLNDHLSPSAEVLEYLWTRLRIIRGMVLRAIEDNDNTRQLQNEYYRQEDLWDQLEPEERSLAMSSGGSWPETDRQRVVEWIEQLRLLRWVLFIDEVLSPLWLEPHLDSESFHLPAKPPDRTRRTWDICTERDHALTYLAGSAQQISSREPGAEILPDLGEEISLLANNRELKDLDNDQLHLLAHTALMRARYADYLRCLLEQNKVYPLAQHHLFEDNQ